MYVSVLVDRCYMLFSSRCAYLSHWWNWIIQDRMSSRVR